MEVSAAGVEAAAVGLAMARSGVGKDGGGVGGVVLGAEGGGSVKERRVAHVLGSSPCRKNKDRLGWGCLQERRRYGGRREKGEGTHIVAAEPSYRSAGIALFAVAVVEEATALTCLLEFASAWGCGSGTGGGGGEGTYVLR